jgi:perosamine synthetase
VYKITQVNPNIGEPEIEAVRASLASTWITEGPRSEEFVEKLNELVGVPYGVLAPNGTLALVLGLMAAGIGPGDEVLVPDITFFGSATAVIMAGATPVCVDVECRTFQIDLDKAKARLNQKTRAIMPVHLYGTACDMQAVMRFAIEHNLQVIEDAAQGIGVRFQSRHVGSFGDVGCFSFFADKTITTGEGGYIACRDSAVYERLRLLRNQGRFDRGSFIHPAIGYNFRMTDMQSAMGLAQLDRLSAIIERKAALLERYRGGLKEVGELCILGGAPGANQVPFRCVVIAQNVRGLSEHLENAGVQTRSFFYPLHRQPALRKFCGADGLAAPTAGERVLRSLDCPRPAFSDGQFDDTEYPNAVYGWEHGLCLPIHPTLKDQDVDFICTSIKGFYCS